MTIRRPYSTENHSCPFETPNSFILYFVGKGPCVLRRSQCERHNCPFFETPKSFILGGGFRVFLCWPFGGDGGDSGSDGVAISPMNNIVSISFTSFFFVRLCRPSGGGGWWWPWRRGRVRREDDETKGMMLKFLAKVMEKHPELCRFLEQVRYSAVRETTCSCFR